MVGTIIPCLTTRSRRAWNLTLNLGPEESLGDEKDKLGPIVQVISD
jgi:hypothetical protein